MAAIRLKAGASFEGQDLYAFTGDTLPAYAAPRFVRIQVSGPRRRGGFWGQFFFGPLQISPLDEGQFGSAGTSAHFQRPRWRPPSFR